MWRHPIVGDEPDPEPTIYDKRAQEIYSLREEVERLKADNSRLKAENTRLRRTVEDKKDYPY